MRRLTLLLFLAFASAAWADTVILSDGPIPAASATATPTPTPSYLVNQGFEGTGYDNSETWTEGGTGTVNEDYTTSPIVGSQSLNMVASAQSANVSVDFASQDIVYVFFRFRFASVSSNPPFVSIRNGATTVAQLSLVSATGKLRVIATGGTQNDSGTGLTSGTDYYIWFEYVKGTGSDAIARAGFSTDGTKPNLTASGTNSCVSSNGTSTAQGNRLFWGGTGSFTMDFVADHVLVDDANIGNNP